MTDNQNHNHHSVLCFRHGSRSIVLMGAILMLAGVGLVYTAIVDPEATPGTMVFLFIMGAVLFSLGAKLALGMEQVEINPISRTWLSRRGVIFRHRETGTFDDIEAIVLERQEHRHGAESYDMFRVFFRRSNYEEIHVGIDRSLEAARSAARALSMRTGIVFKDESEGPRAPF